MAKLACGIFSHQEYNLIMHLSMKILNFIEEILIIMQITYFYNNKMIWKLKTYFFNFVNM